MNEETRALIIESSFTAITMTDGVVDGWLCKECGVYVYDRDVHFDWHGGVQRSIYHSP